MSDKRLLFALILIEIIGLNEIIGGKSALYSPDHAKNNGANSKNGTGDDYITMDAGKILKRDKRYLLFTGGGISKIVLGFLAPVETRDKVNWRTLNLAYNFQAQYVPIPTVTFLWDRFSRELRQQKNSFDTNGAYRKDLTRELVYGALELFLEYKRKPGRQCLLKAICEAAEHPIQRHGVFDEIVHLVLTPPKDEDIHVDYLNAREAGEHGNDCAKVYELCRPGDGLLDSISVLH